MQTVLGMTLLSSFVSRSRMLTHSCLQTPTHKPQVVVYAPPPAAPTLPASDTPAGADPSAAANTLGSYLPQQQLFVARTALWEEVKQKLADVSGFPVHQLYVAKKAMHVPFDLVFVPEVANPLASLWDLRCAGLSSFCESVYLAIMTVCVVFACTCLIVITSR